MTQYGISSKVDETGQSIGKRYARTDEIGVPFGITIDHDTLTNNTVTLRERDTTNQVRVKIEDLPLLLVKLVNGGTTWSDVEKQFPKVEAVKE